MSVMMSLSWCRVSPRRTHSSCRGVDLRGDRARLHLRDFCDIKYESCSHKERIKGGHRGGGKGGGKTGVVWTGVVHEAVSECE